MKRSIIITLALIAAIAVPLCASSGWARGLGVLGLTGGGVVTAPAGYVCAGDFLAGDNESFEAGADLFCTTNISKTAGDSYSTSFASTGTHGYITNSAPSWVVSGQLAESDNDTYARVIWRPADITANTYNFIAAVSYTNAFDYRQVVQVAHRKWTTAHGVFLCSQTGACSEDFFTVQPGAKYSIQLHAVGTNGTSTMKMYQCSGGTWVALTSNSSAQTISSVNTTGYPAKFFLAGNDVASGEAFDDIVFDVDASDYIGNPPCE